MYQNILVAVDGSGPAERACRRAAELARNGASRLTIVSVAHSRQAPEDPWSDEAETRTTTADPSDKAATVVEQAATMARTLGVERIETRVLRGLPAIALAHEAKEGTYDLLVVGHRGLSKFDTLRLGSVSEPIAHQAPCEILLVP